MSKKCAHSLARLVLVWLIILSGAGCRIFTDNYPTEETDNHYRKQRETNTYILKDGTMFYFK